MTVPITTKAKILQKIELIPNDKLELVLSFLEKIESRTSKKNKIMSFAGKWKDLDKEVLNDLTINLSKNRANDVRPN